MRSIICALLGIYLLVLLARAILSWIPVAPDSPWASVNQFLWRVTEPIMAPVRQLIPVVQVGGMGLDLSFLVVFLGISILRQVIC